MDNNLLLIINPSAGKGNICKKIPKIIKNFEKNEYKIITVYTKQNYKPMEIIEQYGRNVSLIVCCGGDGTLNETVNAIVKLNLNVNLSFIPLGTMNDFAKTIHISRKKLELSKKIDNFDEISSDVGAFNEKIFNYVVAFGAFTKVSYATPRKFKKFFGKIAYFVTAIKYLNTIKPYKVKVKFEDKEIEDTFIYGAISNSKTIGGLKWFNNKNFSINDGKFEMILIKKPKNIFHMIKIIYLFLRKNYDKKYYICEQISKAKFEFEQETEWTIDRRIWRRK